MAKKEAKAKPNKTYADNAKVVADWGVNNKQPVTPGTIIGERNGITLLAMAADSFSGITAHIRAQSKNSAVWRVYRRHIVKGDTGHAAAYYHIKDLRGWEVGHANTLADLYTCLLYTSPSPRD